MNIKNIVKKIILVLVIIGVSVTSFGATRKRPVYVKKEPTRRVVRKRIIFVRKAPKRIIFVRRATKPRKRIVYVKREPRRRVRTTRRR